MDNGGWCVGPHLIVTQSRRGQAYLRACDKSAMYDDPRAAVRFSLDSVDAIFLSFADAAAIVSVLELAGIDSQITDMNAVSS